VKIAVDAMGGDKGPEIVARGAIEAAATDPNDLHIVLVGDKERVERVLEKEEFRLSNISVVHASEEIGMSEPPATAVRKKKDSSLAVALRMHKDREVDGVISAGNTGAVVAGSLVTLGRLHGVSRPALVTFYPTAKEWAVFLDVGANSECTPKNLLQFGIMGSVFAQYQLSVENPRVGLLNIGEEKSKGTETIRQTHTLMEHAGMNFLGNVEGRDIFAGQADVVVCDGFVGNVVLKFTENIFRYTNSLFRQEIRKSKKAQIGAFLMRDVFGTFKQKLDYAEYGGAPLLGINGVVIIGHGRSSIRAIKNAILIGQRFVKHHVNDHIEQRFKELKESVANVAKVS